MHNHCQQHLQRCVHNRETSSQWVKTSENKIQMNIAFKNYIICHLTLSEDLLIEIIHLNQKLPQAVIPYCTVFRINQELGRGSAAWAGCQKGELGVINPWGSSNESTQKPCKGEAQGSGRVCSSHIPDSKPAKVSSDHPASPIPFAVWVCIVIFLPFKPQISLQIKALVSKRKTNLPSLTLHFAGLDPLFLLFQNTHRDKKFPFLKMQVWKTFKSPH